MRNPWRALVALGVLGLFGCGDSPTTPTPVAHLREYGPGMGELSDCDTYGACLFTASIQNQGSGCAAGTIAVALFFGGGAGALISEAQMEAPGGLSSRTIRPTEIVALTSTYP